MSSDDPPGNGREAADDDRAGAEDEPAPPEPSQEELNRTSRATGGDAPAAGSIEEREAVARDEDELFTDEDE